MTAFDVRVMCGADYAKPPVSGDGLMPSDVLTNAALWIAAGFGYDNTQPAPVPEVSGMRLSWTTDDGKTAVQGAWFNGVAGHRYTVSITVQAAAGSAPWKGVVGWGYAESAWVTPNGTEQTVTVQFTAPETRTYLPGVYTDSRANSSTHLVTSIGAWDQADGSVVWEPGQLAQCSVALPLTITHGRSSVTAQPDAPTCQFTYLGPNPPGEVGDLVEVVRPSADQATWTDDGVSWVDGEFTWLGARDVVPKFVGSLVALNAIEEGGEVVRWEVSCVGRQAALGRIPILMVRPVETDVERVQAIAAEVGYVLNIVGDSDLLLSADTINMDALQALHQICTSAGGMLWQGRSGDLWYGTANHRERPVENVIDCELILDGVEWRNDQENIVNRVEVTWGRESASDDVDAVWNYRAQSAASDPGTGNVHYSTGLIAFARVDQTGFDMAPVLRQLTNGAIIYAQQKSNADNYERFSVSGAVVDNGSWFQIPVTSIDSGGVGLSNNTHVAVRFGATSKQQRTYSDEASIDRWGLRHLSVDTLLLGETQAGQLGLLILGRRAQPYWTMPGVLADYGNISASEAARLDALDVSEGVTLPIEVFPTPTPGDQTEWTCEGWVEEWARDGHFLQLALSDRRRTGAVGLRNWAEMRDAGDWTYWTGRKWIDALVKGVGE